jgi:hypothetical protein
MELLYETFSDFLREHDTDYDEFFREACHTYKIREDHLSALQVKQRVAQAIIDRVESDNCFEIVDSMIWWSHTDKGQTFWEFINRKFQSYYEGELNKYFLYQDGTTRDPIPIIVKRRLDYFKFDSAIFKTVNGIQVLREKMFPDYFLEFQKRIF